MANLKILKRAKAALQKQLGGGIPPEAKEVYEQERKKGIIEGAKIAGRREGRAKGKAMGQGRGFGRGILQDISTGAGNVLNSDAFGLGDLGSGLVVDSSGMLDVGGGSSGARRHKRKKGTRKSHTITINVNGSSRKHKKKRTKKTTSAFDFV